LFFTVAYAFSWATWLPIVASDRGWVTWDVPYALYYVGSLGPMVAAVLVTGLTRGQAGVATLLARVFKWRVPWRYYVFAVLAPCALFLTAAVGNRVFLGEWPRLSLLGEADYLPPLGPAGVLGLWLLTYGLGEEVGWRGFGLPHLQRTRTAASATLILALLWAFWHLPAFFFRDTYVELGLFGFPMFAIVMIFAAMVLTWLYNSTRGSLLLVILFHAVFNWLSVSEAGGQYAPVIMSAPTVLWALYVVRRNGPENAAPAPKQVP
jgi:membrane protease YdiL (CAAX protease family)